MSLHIIDEFDTRSTSSGRPRAEDVHRMSSAGLPTGVSASLALLRYWAAIKRHSWRIAIFVAVTILCTAFILLRIPKEYEGTATVRVDPSEAVNVVGNQSGNSNSFNMGPQLATDIKEIVSPAVVTPAIVKLGLWKPKGSDPSKATPSAIVARVTGGIKASQVVGTYLINISYRSKSPSRAAAVANAIAEQFIVHEYETRNSALVSLSQYMRQQIQHLGDRMKDSQLALNAFERDNNIVNPNNMSNLLTQQLSSLQQELGQEQAKQRSLEANLALVKAGNLDSLLVSDRGSALVPLLKDQQQAEMKFSSLSSKYGSGNYLYKQQKRNLTQISEAVKEEEQHIAAQIKAQAKAEAVQTRLTAKKLAQVQNQLNDFNRKSVQFAILKHKSNTDKTIYDDLLERLDTADIAAGYHSTALRIVNPARPDATPVYPRIKMTLLFAFLISGLLGILGAIATSEMDRTLRDPGDVRDALGVELLGFLPEAKDESDLKSLVTSSDGRLGASRTPFAESLLGIRSTLLLKDPDPSLHALAVLSCQAQEGKTTLAVNLAASFAALGKRTVVVDADILQPRLHRILNVSNRSGLSSLLLDQVALDDVLKPTSAEQLTVLTAGPPSARARELLGGGIESLIEDLKSRFDIVIFDTPPVLGFADALNVAAVVDDALLVVRAGKTPREYVQAAMEQMRQVQASLAGIVLNAVRAQSSPYYRWYSEGHYSKYATANGNHDSSQS